MKKHLFFTMVLVTMLVIFSGCALCLEKTCKAGGEYQGGVRHAAIVIDGYEQFGTVVLANKEMLFYVKPPYIGAANLQPTHAKWQWGSQAGKISLKGKKWPGGKIKYDAGKLRRTIQPYEGPLYVEVFYEEVLYEVDHNGSRHYYSKPVSTPLAKGEVNVYCHGLR